jgi:6-phosphogluconolactonase
VAACLLAAALAGCGTPFFISEKELREVLSGREYLFTAEGTGVGAYAIDPSSGAITTMPGSPFGGGCISSVAATPDAEHLYALSFYNSDVRGYGIDGDGVPQLLAGFPRTLLGGPRGIAIEPQGRFGYIVHASSNDWLTTWGIDRNTGALTSLPPDLGVGCSPAAVVVDGSGKYIYTTEGFPTAAIRKFQIDQTTGAPLGLGNTIGQYSTSLRAHPSGYLYALSPSSSDRNILAYRVEADGSLTDITGGTPYRLGFGPTNLSGASLAVDASRDFLYASANETDELFQYRIDTSTGALSITHGLGTANGAAIATSAGGRYVFAGGDNGSGGGVIYAYRVADNGTLTAVPGSPFPVASGQVHDALVVSRFAIP